MDFEGCRKGRIQAIEPWWPEGKPVGLVAWWPGGRLVAVGLVAWRSRGCLVAWTPGGLELRIQPWAQKALKSNSVKRNVKGK